MLGEDESTSLAALTGWHQPAETSEDWPKDEVDTAVSAIGAGLEVHSGITKTSTDALNWSVG